VDRDGVFGPIVDAGYVGGEEEARVGGGEESGRFALEEVVEAALVGYEVVFVTELVECVIVVLLS
jgi:hypothetical protein